MSRFVGGREEGRSLLAALARAKSETLPGVMVEDHTPADWKVRGGAYWVVRTTCRAEVAAMRASNRESWNVFNVGGMTALQITAARSDREILAMLHQLLTEAVGCSLAELLGK